MDVRIGHVTFPPETELCGRMSGKYTALLSNLESNEYSKQLQSRPTKLKCGYLRFNIEFFHGKETKRHGFDIVTLLFFNSASYPFSCYLNALKGF